MIISDLQNGTFGCTYWGCYAVLIFFSAFALCGVLNQKAFVREQQTGGSGGSLEPPGPLLDPPGPLLTQLHTVYMAYSERLPTRLNPLAERACFSQALAWAMAMFDKPYHAQDIASVRDSNPNCTGWRCRGP